MSKIFRLHSGADNTITNWADTGEPIGETFIDTIKDPNGATDRERITSIPSPFAGMDIVRTAFKWINEHNKLEGSTMYHKLVSDCLDVAEIFFNIHSLGKKIKLLSWDPGIVIIGGEITINPASDLGHLIHSNDVQHCLFGETLELYLRQDAKAYGFRNLKRIFLLQYIGDGGTSVIGGTSPSTLFFPSANDFSYINDISFGTHRVFSENYCPLHNRNEDFIKHLFSLKASIPNFNSIFKEVDEYLTHTLGHTGVSQLLRATINGILKTPNYFFNNYLPVDVGGAGNPAEVLGFPLLADQQHANRIENNSAFVIDATKDVPSPLPLVLPNGSFTYGLIYTFAVWDNNKRAPYANDLPFSEINSRTLPHQISTYPYLTSDDLFEPYLIRTIFPIQKEKYFDGNLKGIAAIDNRGYILPLKQNIFHYFSVNDIQGLMADGKPMFEMEHQSLLKVKATLRIPIRSATQKQKEDGGFYTKHYVEFVREYDANVKATQIQQPDIKKNKGIIVENQFTLSINPFLKTGTDNKADYRIMLLDRDVAPITINNKFGVSFYKDTLNSALGILAKRKRSDKNNGEDATTEYYILNQEFDYLQLGYGQVNGIVVPKFVKVSPGTAVFTFAIDFGTTNTHIEYSVNGNAPRPLEITQHDEQSANLHYAATEANSWIGKANDLNYNASIIPRIIGHELMPLHIAPNTEFKFPQRSVVSQNNRLDLAETIYSQADISIFFNHEKYIPLPSERITTNLKWNSNKLGNFEVKKVEAFFDQLISIIKNKVLFNKGDLSATKLVWFYPSSMTIHRRNSLEAAWTKAFQKQISDNVPVGISESIAPFYYYSKTQGVIAAKTPVLSLDIGGGTTDVVLFKNDGHEVNVPVLQTSFKFAANSIYGDGYGSSPALNGFVNKYSTIIEGLLASNNLMGGLGALASEIKTENNSEDINSFYFSIKDNRFVKEKNADISYSNLLQADDEMKIVFLLFYTSIIYYVAKMMKAEGINAPANLLFSGNGSKLIRIIDGSNNFSSLALLTSEIFKLVELENVQKVSIKHEVDPKLITAKGGLHNPTAELNNDKIKVFKYISGKSEAEILKYQDISSETVVEGVVSNFKLFIEDFFALNNVINFQTYFAIPGTALESYRSIMLEELENSLYAGISSKLKEVTGNEGLEVEETLFFYPMVGILNKLAYKISQGI